MIISPELGGLGCGLSVILTIPFPGCALSREKIQKLNKNKIKTRADIN